MHSICLKSMEHATKNAAVIQRELLQQILEKNAGTEYLTRHGLDEESNLVDGFHKLPLVEYNDIEADIKRIADGDTGRILCSDPISQFFISSGTTTGRSKLIPVTKEANSRFFRPPLISPAWHRVFTINPDETYLAFWFASKQSLTKGGFKAETVTTSGLNSAHFKRAAASFVTPHKIFQSTSMYQCLYCHLLCGLLRREEVTVVISAFAFALTEAFRVLEQVWSELLEDIEAGSLSSRITDPILRLAMSGIAPPSPELAEQLRREFRSFSMDGIVQRLWPNAKSVVAVTTGAMAPYAPRLRALAGKTPLVCGNYFSSECLIGINLSPASSPATFTVNPEFAYFEFLSYHDGETKLNGLEEQRPVGLTEVTIGEKYEIVVTTRSGLYRYRLGDVVQVAGFFNSSPSLRFLFRRNVVMSVATDKTDEFELQAVVHKASLLLRSSSQLHDFAGYADFSSIPGHYAIFWELNHGGSMDPSTLQDCCELLDVSLNDPYLRGRSSGAIGPLKLCVVRGGSFRELFEQHVARGGSGSQYKSCRCVASKQAIDLLRRNTLQQALSSKFPNPWKLSIKSLELDQ
ncbi:hypothetical protein SELMODRAFT_85812 [Selaginella moellendorffii]|uniref:Uncharacterized protein n=1 Tax=Selaginella moellendorffii TaxID=88036 RepID=D8R4W5_SELML|nr:hypothetical protein SELMODRAFT_85812 [Selaginella moellendorffii]